MTDEEYQRQVEFIVNTLAGLTAKLDGVAEIQAQSELERKADEVRTGRLEESFVILTQLAQSHQEWLQEHHSRIEGMEQALVILTKLVSEGRNGQA